MTKFTEQDPVEQMMGKKVEVMEPRELFDYFEAWFEGLFERKLPQDREREMSYFKYLKRVYGVNAGRIIKWAFFKYGGERTDAQGRKTKIGPSTWGTSQKWWHDQLLDEMLTQVNKERKSKKASAGEMTQKVPSNFKTLEDLL